MTERSAGQLAYEAYCEFSQGKSLISGATLPSWDDQSLEIRQAWHAAAIAAVGRYRQLIDELTQELIDAVPSVQ